MALCYALLSVLFLPWCCESLQAMIISSRLPLISTFLLLIIPLLHVTQVVSSESDESELSLENCCIEDNFNGTEQEQRQWQLLEDRQLYLLSLNWIQENDPEYFLKKDIRRLWEWKDTALGSGRDYFVPKPKTLMALQHYLLENIPNLMECSIISNCARLEVLCCYSCAQWCDQYGREEIAEMKKKQEMVLVTSISNCFVAQLDHYRNLSRNSNLWNQLLFQLPLNTDNPESILTMELPRKSPQLLDGNYDSWWNLIVGPKAILNHTCKISAGIGRRPRRPHRPVVFRPFSSRDAHILLQLKRTREIIGFSSNGDDGRTMDQKNTLTKDDEEKQGKRKLLPIILDCALRAGKAARNSEIVPETMELKELTSAESSVLSLSEKETSERVANAAYEKGIQPLINKCLARLNSANTDRKIVKFRQSAFRLLLEIGIYGAKNDADNAIDDNEVLKQKLRSWLNRRLHEPTIKIRSLSRQQNNKVMDTDDGDDIGNIKDIESYISGTLREIQEDLRKEHHRLQMSRPEISVICKWNLPCNFNKTEEV